MSESQLTGRGWHFPPYFSSPANGPMMVEAEEEIRQSLRILIGTALGERIMRPGFGTPLAEFQFTSLDYDSLSMLSERMSDAIDRLEPRINLKRVDVDASNGADGLLTINVVYMIRDTNARDNLVYPFYLQEQRT
ncbi:GPW/gp25 family protein [Endozoicomonas lisbonensis]|uniref:Phage baseplate assembly protein W n=1 Tax=Endozoicomonas lisbonensis TaxID=3120522 RepID=A0ABV2SAW9_9GAMM